MRSFSRCLSLSALALAFVGCGGGGHSSSGDGSTTSPSIVASFSVTAPDIELTGVGADPDGHIAVVQAQATNGTVSSLSYRSASGTKALTFPAGYSLIHLYGVSGHYVVFTAGDLSDNDASGVLVLNVSTQKTQFELGRRIEAIDEDRIMTSGLDGSGKASDFRIETFTSDSATVSKAQAVPLPANAGVYQMAGDYLLVHVYTSSNEIARSKVRPAWSARPQGRKARVDGEVYSLYTTSGTKVFDYAGLAKTTLDVVFAINAKGEAVGTLNGTGDSYYGVSWSKLGDATYLLGGGLGIVPESITDAGAIIARYAPNADDYDHNVAYYYANGKKSTLSSIPTDFSGISITRSGKGIGTFAYNDTASVTSTTIDAYTVR